MGVFRIPLDTSIERSNNVRYCSQIIMMMMEMINTVRDSFFCFHASTKESKDDQITCLEKSNSILFLFPQDRKKRTKINEHQTVRHYQYSKNKKRLYNFNLLLIICQRAFQCKSRLKMKKEFFHWMNNSY